MGQILAFHILDTGYCQASENHILSGGPHRQVPVHSLVGLIQHSNRGWVLFDTGYAPRMVRATRGWPYRLYRLATPFYAPEQLAVASQLAKFGLGPADIGQIIVSHFHADHVGGLADFPNARFVCSRAAYQAIDGQKGLRALGRAFIPSLLPEQFEDRASLIDGFSDRPLPGLGNTHDLFGDGAIGLVPLPGHARGQIGALVQSDQGAVLLAADGAWYRQAIRERRPPARVASLFVDDRQAVQVTIDRLHHFSTICPEVTIIPSHCPEAFRQYCL